MLLTRSLFGRLSVRHAAAFDFTIVCLATLVTILWPTRALVAPLDPTTEPRVMSWDLSYLGAFRLPAGPTDALSFDYGGTAPAYNPINDSLFLVGDDQVQRVAEINIPAILTGAAVTDLATATLRQPFADVLQGRMNAVGSGTAKIGGLLPYGDHLIVSDYLYYDGTGSQTASHFVTGTGLGSGAVNGPYTISNSLGLAGFVDGSMTAIPAEWQSLLGGPYLTGQCCIAVVSRTSLGPSATVFDPAALGITAPVPGTTVLGYPISHATLGAWASNSTLYNGTTTVMGMVFPAGTRSVLFFGHQGTGPFCYGDGTANQALAGTLVGPSEPGVIYCYDPTGPGKGPHGYPYQHQVWAYDANDLVAVKNGTKHPWDVLPYATWTFDLPFETAGRLTGGATYDPATQRLFVVDQGIETTGFAYRPLIHAYKLTAGSPVPYTPPPPPPPPPPTPTPPPPTPTPPSTTPTPPPTTPTPPPTTPTPPSTTPTPPPTTPTPPPTTPTPGTTTIPAPPTMTRHPEPSPMPPALRPLSNSAPPISTSAAPFSSGLATIRATTAGNPAPGLTVGAATAPSPPTATTTPSTTTRPMSVTPLTPPPPVPQVTVSVSGIVRKVEIYGQPSVWSIVSDEGKTYTPLNGLDITLRSDGLRVSIQGVLRPDVASRVAGGKTIELNSINSIK